MNSDILNQFTYGMYAVGVKGENGPSACICTSVSQVSPMPDCRISVCMSRENYSHACIERTGIFSVSILSKNTSGAVIGALGFTSGRFGGKLKNIRHRVLREGVPVIKEDTCCWVLCQVVGKADAGTHTIFIGKVLAGCESFVGEPMTYEDYRTQIKGVPARNAPIYLPQAATRGQDGESFICPVCGYRFSDPDTPFEELPENCPSCGVPRSAFVRG